MLTSISLRSFRNIENMYIEPCDGVNVIFGQNAQGKTNLLEAIWLFTGCRSFRTNKDKELITFGKKNALLSLSYFAQEREQTMDIEIDSKRTFFQNGIKRGSGSKIIGQINAVVFAPNHLNIIKGGPAERRKFTDIAISQLKPKYAALLMQYNKALAQRNALIKDLFNHPELEDTLDIWEDRLAFFGVQLVRQRMGYIEMLSKKTADFYSGIASGTEQLALEYKQSVEIIGDTPEAMREHARNLFKLYRRQDIAAGFTTIGPHRDDLNITINGNQARLFASQGQQRSASLAMKLGEAELVSDISGTQPIILLDDVMSELDPTRQNYILNHIKGRQVFITCCEPATVGLLNGGERFEISDGKLVLPFGQNS